MLRALLRDIVEKKGEHQVTLQLYDDATPSNANASVVREFQKQLSIEYFKSPINQGKRGYWRTINNTFKHLPKADYYMYLPDDITLSVNFFDVAITTWKAIVDPLKVCLNLLSDSRTGKAVWTPVTPRKHKSYLGYLWESGWVDMCFVCEEKFFKLLGYEIKPIDPIRWATTEKLSSGVGQQISERLYKLGTLWQVHNSLVIHDEHPSQMHPWRKIPLVTNHA